MNQENGTLVTAEMLKRLKEMGVDIGYREVPESFHDKAARLLGTEEIVDISEETKSELQNESRLESMKREIEDLRRLEHQQKG